MPLTRNVDLRNLNRVKRATTNLDPITYNDRYPGLDEYNYNKLSSKIDSLGLSGYDREKAMDEAYIQVLPLVQNDIKNSDRRKYINQAKYEVSQIQDPTEQKQANMKLSTVELAQLVKEKYNVDPTANDEEVFNSWIETIPNGEQLLADYMNTGDKTLLYESGLAEKPKETLGEKYADVMAGIMQSPGKWGYNILGQWMDKAAHGMAEKILDKEIPTDENTFKGREATDIRTTLVGEDRANSKYTKGGEVVGDIASGIALTAPIGATLAPAIANSSILGAGLAGGAEGFIDTAITHYGREGDLDITPMEGILGTAGGVLGGLFTRYLANLPKSQADNIRKEAEGYINKSIKPKTNAKVSQSDINKFTDNVLDVAEVMSKNKGSEVLQYTDDAGNIITGKLPTNLKETSETLNNLKKVVYDQYDDIARRAGDAGARVDLNKVFDNLDDLTKDTAQNLSNSNTLSIVDDWKNRLLQYSDDAGTISIGDAQKTVQDLNNQLTTFFKNVSNSADDVSKNAIKAKVNRWMLDAIDDSIDDTLSTGIKNSSNMSAVQEYTQLRQFYGKIKNIEGEIAKRTMQDMKKMPGMTSELLDALSGGEFTQAILSLDPVTFGKAGAIKLLNKYFQYMNNPNVNINKLFKLIDNVNNQGAISSAVTNVSDAVRQGLQKSANIIPEVLLPGGISAGEALKKN